ncbi:hypothetical protein ONZ45_g8175 [Pleurotus djamor]|nr:hypothetical protein ONZ45_g8175 [Pleurotus djamor]
MLIYVPIQFAMAWRLKSYTNFRVRVIPGAVLLINLRSILYIGMGIIAARKAIQQDSPNIPPTPSDLKIAELSSRRFAVYTGYIFVAVVIDAIMTIPLFMIFAGRTSFKRFGADKRLFIQKMLVFAAVTFGALTTIGILIKLDLHGNDHEPGDPHKIYQSLTTFIPQEFVLSKLYTLTLLTVLSAGLLRIECNASEFAQTQRPVPEVKTADNEGSKLWITGLKVESFLEIISDPTGPYGFAVRRFLDDRGLGAARSRILNPWSVLLYRDRALRVATIELA